MFFARTLRVAAYLWLALSGAFVIFSYVEFVREFGFGALWQIMNTFSIIPWYVAPFVPLLPGAGLLYLAERMEKRR